MLSGLRARLSLSYMIITLTCVLIITLIANVFLEKQFRQYTLENQENRNRETLHLISQQYSGNGQWNRSVVEDIGVNALEQGMVVKVTDGSDRVIWDATTHNDGMCKQMLDDMAKTMSKHYKDWDGKFAVSTYPVFQDLKEVGFVSIGSYGPFYYNNNDLAFLRALNKMLLGAGLLSLILALALGLLMAGRLSNPISRVVRASENISRGFYKERVLEKSGTREIRQLAAAINHLAESLEKQEQLRKRMTADVAHDLRTPLATVQSHLEAMVDGVWEPEVKRLAGCHDEILRISRLVDDLEKLSTLESVDFQLKKENYNLYEQVQQIVHHFEISFRNKGVKLNLFGSPVPVSADRDKISQMLFNLLSNALKYTPSGGYVDIYLNKGEKTAEIKIRDTGTGIPTEDLPYIFERFYRADKSRHRSTGGSGLGLSIVKAIVDAHKGEVTVQSTPDKGAEFTVSIPVS